MKRTLTLIICAVLSLNIAFAQWQTDAPKSHLRLKSTKNLNFDKGIAEISGGITSATNYIPGSTMLLDFELTFASPDAEYVDGFTLTFPTGMVPQTTGTSATVDDATLAPITGQTVL